VDTQGLLGAENLVDLDSLLGVDVLVAQELARQIGSNRKQTQVDFAVFLTDLFKECFFVPRVARIVDLLIFGSHNQKPSPQALEMVEDASARPVAAR